MEELPSTRRGKQGGLPRKWARASRADDWRRRELERRNATKYHYVKFVERKKVNRKLQTCRRLILEAMGAGRAEEAAKLKEELRAHLADLEYVTHYPKHLPYNALFPAVDSEASKRRREEIRKLIRESLVREGEDVAADPDEEEPDDFFEAGDGVVKSQAALPAKPRKGARRRAADAEAEAVAPSGAPRGEARRPERKARRAAAADAPARGGAQEAEATEQRPSKKRRRLAETGGGAAADAGAAARAQDMAEGGGRAAEAPGTKRRAAAAAAAAAGAATKGGPPAEEGRKRRRRRRGPEV